MDGWKRVITGVGGIIVVAAQDLLGIPEAAIAPIVAIILGLILGDSVRPMMKKKP